MRDYRQDARALNLPLVFSPFFEEVARAHAWSSADVALATAFREQGYVVLEEPIVDSATVDRALSDLEGRYDDVATGYDEPSRKQDAWRFSEAVSAIARAPRVLELLELMYGRTAFPFQTLNFRLGTRQRAHSDTVHFHSIPQRFMAGVWVALEDIHPDSGPLVVHPRSHLLPTLDPFDLGLEATWDSYRDYESAIEAIVEAMHLEPHPLLLKRGQAVIWAANLIHGGSAVADPARTRLSQASHYYFEACAYYQPAASDPMVGRLALKQVREVGTNRLVPNTYRGKPITEWLPSRQNGGMLSRLLSR